MHTLAVGQPYIAGKASWPEGAEYNYMGGEHELRIFWSQPSDLEIRSVRRAPLHLALLVDGPIIALVWRFEGIGDWSDSLYTWHLVPADRQTIPPETSGEQRALLHVVLVDAATGILRAMRAVTLPPLATQQLHAAIRAQAALPWDRANYDAAIARLYERYPDSTGMARAATQLVRAGT